jgi:Cu-Zn family superoxide dismutase
MSRIIAAALAAACCAALVTAAAAATTKAEVFLAAPNGVGGPAGRVMFRDAPGGATVRVDLYGLPPGQHGFHIHQNPSCGPGEVNGAMASAGAAGGHYDPMGTAMHRGPYGKGHLGDLPFLTIDANGSEHQTLVAPRITDVNRLKGHSVVIHAGGDNYADQPQPLGGGGARIACGVIG